MTGQEWYARFENEIGDITQENAYDILREEGAAGIYLCLIAAAQRASGVSE